MTNIPENVKNKAKEFMELLQDKVEIKEQFILDDLHDFLTQALLETREETLRNVPVGFVRQWINEDVKSKDHRLVTNEDIQEFINVALTQKNK